jgi:hypothetical protein
MGRRKKFFLGLSKLLVYSGLFLVALALPGRHSHRAITPSEWKIVKVGSAFFGLGCVIYVCSRAGDQDSLDSAPGSSLREKARSLAKRVLDAAGREAEFYPNEPGLATTLDLCNQLCDLANQDRPDPAEIAGLRDAFAEHQQRFIVRLPGHDLTACFWAMEQLSG